MKPMRVRIHAVGDILLAESPYCSGFGIRTLIREKGPGYPFRHVREALAGADLVLGNLEAPISESSPREGIWRDFFRADPEATAALDDGHFSVVSVANNHIMEHGEEGFRSTLRHLRERGILPAGARNGPEVITIGGVRVGFFAYSFIGDPVAGSLYNRAMDEGPVIGEIARHRGELDLVVVMLHWGEENVHDPSPEQVRIGRAIADGGADIVIGSHPHVIQGYEIHNGKLIAYSLGNFLFENIVAGTGKTFIARIDVELPSRAVTVEPVPVVSDRDRYCPKPAEGADRSAILGLIDTLNRRIQDVPDADYARRSGDYGRIARSAKRRADAQIKLHFLRNIPRYPLAVSSGIIGSYLRKFRVGP